MVMAEAVVLNKFRVTPSITSVTVLEALETDRPLIEKLASAPAEYCVNCEPAELKANCDKPVLSVSVPELSLDTEIDILFAAPVLSETKKS